MTLSFWMFLRQKVQIKWSCTSYTPYYAQSKIQSSYVMGRFGAYNSSNLQLFFYKPKLWWPNGMGKQPLYNITISVVVKGFGESDTWNHLFGFRKIESYIDSATGGRLFKVNGEPVFIRGGNWILSDGLLRLSKKRYQTDIKFHADMNFNMLRCWGGGLAEKPEFHHYCNVYGLLIYMIGWVTRRFELGTFCGE